MVFKALDVYSCMVKKKIIVNSSSWEFSSHLEHYALKINVNYTNAVILYSSYSGKF